MTWEINCSRTIYRSPSVYQSLRTHMLKISFKGVNETLYSQFINVCRCCTTYFAWVHWSKNALHLCLCRRTIKITSGTLVPWKQINWFSLLAESFSTKVIIDIFETTSASRRVLLFHYQRKFIWYCVNIYNSLRIKTNCNTSFYNLNWFPHQTTVTESQFVGVYL